MPQAKLHAAIENLYAVFQTAKPGVITGCSHCLDEKDISTLLGKELRALTPDDLAPYASSVFLTVGEESDFRYFLPRIFEIAALDDDWWPSPEVSIKRLKLANWQTWPRNEQEVLRDFLAAWLDVKLASDPPNIAAVDAIVCGVALSGDDLNSILGQVFQHSLALALYHDQNVDKLKSAFWADDPSAKEAVVRFLTSARVQGRIREVAR